MAQLKLMKKEWFNWFDKTFLDNITAWSEYYYINPDGMVWRSNNFLDLEHGYVAYGVSTYEVSMGKVVITGYKSRARFYVISVPIFAGNYTLSLNVTNIVHNSRMFVGFVVEKNDGTRSYYSIDPTATGIYTLNVTIPEDVKSVRFDVNINDTNSDLETPNELTIEQVNLIPGSVLNPVYNPYLIKIEDILGVAKLKDLNWAGTNGSYYVRVSDMKVESARSDKVFTTKYPSSISSSHSFAHIFTESGYINVIDDNHPTLSEFKDYLGDEYVIYLKVDSPY